MNLFKRYKLIYKIPTSFNHGYLILISSKINVNDIVTVSTLLTLLKYILY